ncbi:o-spanin [Citrobacter phage Moogle]|uniref:O-spanin n=2 Tax=Mooglevirus moogle TaxID=1985304 RepID=A0A0A0RVW9_9CAUD|nr:o-spanin [Citrobacter phage Moogle]AIW03858.1 o-spanin [Citrobacter phage Moogle]ARB06620.1 o-spanin [Citrobacter phage Mijalis]
MKKLRQSFIIFVLLSLISGCSTNKVNSTFKNSQVSESDKYTQEETRYTVKGTKGEDLASAMEFYRDGFYECAIKANNLIDMILLGNKQQ